VTGVAGGLDIIKLTKIILIYSASCFNLGELEDCLGGISPSKCPHGDVNGATAVTLEKLYSRRATESLFINFATCLKR